MHHIAKLGRSEKIFRKINVYKIISGVLKNLITYHIFFFSFFSLPTDIDVGMYYVYLH